MNFHKVIEGFYVKEIIDDTKLIINYGIKDGANHGQKVIVFDAISEESGSNAIDPLETKKDTLEITETYLNYSLCRKVEYGPSQIDLIASTLSPLSPMTSRQKRIEAFKANQEEMSHRTVEFDNTIHTGDPVLIIND